MGYYTEHTLIARKVSSQYQFEKLTKRLKEMELIGYAFNDGTYDSHMHEAVFHTYGECKWYSHAEDMVAIAESFPNIYFELEGIGEEFGDFWKEYYHDMDIECCHGEIVYERPKKVQWTELVPF